MKNGTKAFLLNVGLMAGISGIVFLFFHFFAAAYYPTFFILNPIFYIVMSIPLCMLLNNYSDGKIESPSMKKLMLFRLIKVIGCLCIFLIGLLLDKEQIVSFSIVFVIYYVVYLILESRFMIAFSENKQPNKLK